MVHRHVPSGWRRATSAVDACATARSLPDMFAAVATGPTRAVSIDAFCLNGVDAGHDDLGPGVLVVDAERPERVHHRSATAERRLSGLGDADWHLARVARQAYATGRSARSQVCSRGGRWLTLHAEPYGDGLVSVVVEPTRPADIARLVVEAYGLSAREQEIVRLLAGGHTNAEISRLLGLSRHTVGDHVKSVFGELAVRSRAELVARLFVDPVTP